MRWSKPKPSPSILLCASAVLASGQPSACSRPLLFTRRNTSWARCLRSLPMATRRSRRRKPSIRLSLKSSGSTNVMSDYKPDSALSHLNHSSHVWAAIRSSRLVPRNWRSPRVFTYFFGKIRCDGRAAGELMEGGNPWRAYSYVRGRGEGTSLRGLSEGRTDLSR